MSTQVVTLEAKPWYTSRLFWLGIVQLLMGILETVRTQLSDVDVQTLVGPVTLGPDADGIVGIVFGVLTLIWRWKTKRPMSTSRELVDVPVKETSGS